MTVALKIPHADDLIAEHADAKLYFAPEPAGMPTPAAVLYRGTRLILHAAPHPRGKRSYWLGWNIRKQRVTFNADSQRLAAERPDLAEWFRATMAEAFPADYLTADGSWTEVELAALEQEQAATRARKSAARKPI